MFTMSEYGRINDEFTRLQNERKSTLKKVWGTILLLVIGIIVLFIALFPNQFSYGETAWILPTYGGMGLVVALIGFLVSMSFMSEKPFMEYLYDQVINKINMDEGLFLDYKAYDKEVEKFNKTGGLFTKYASVKVRRHIKGATEEHHSFNIYDCTMTTSNGKNQQTHFDGMYFVLNKRISSTLQVRANGSPKLKGVKFKRFPEFEHMKVYKEEGHEITNLDQQFLGYAERLSQRIEYKRVYLAIVDGEIHLALWYRKHPTRKHKGISMEMLNKAYEHFLGEYKMIGELANIGNY